MQSAVSGLMQAFNAEFASDGTDWDFVPYDMYLYGGGGIGGWASLCGIPNGCVALLNLIGLHGALGADVMGHYSISEWPTSQLPDLYDDPYYGTGGTGGYTWVKHPIPDDEVLAHVIPYSPLCHISISKWCYAAGVSLTDMGPYAYQHKNDRCGKLCADMAAYTAELINAYATTSASADPYSLPAETAACGVCHTSGNTVHGPATTGKMDCAECHKPGTYHTPNKIVIEDAWTEDGSGNPKDTFTSGDPIVVKVKFALMGAGTAYVKTVKSKVRGKCGRIMACQKAETLMSGVHTWDWSGTVPSGCAGAAKVVMELKSFDYEGGSLVSDVRDVHGFTIA
jgi:hypothetical protein